MIDVPLDPAVVAQLDALARRLGIQAAGEDREANRRQEVIQRLLQFWTNVYCHRPLETPAERFCSVCRRHHGPEVTHPCE